MSLTLKDLWIPDGYRPVMKGPAERIMRHASLADLVEVLKQEGAEIRQWYGPIALHPKGRPDLGDDLPAGRYLVLPLDGTPPK